MRPSLRGVLALLLVLGVVLDAAGCSLGTSSKISKSETDKLNSATAAFNAWVAAIDAKGNKGIRSCSGKANRQSCMAKVVAQHDSALRAAALTWAKAFDRTAAAAHGSCQAALKKVAGTIRADAAKISRGVFPGSKGLDKVQSDMADACNLSIRSPSTTA